MGGLAFLAQEYSRLPGEKCAGAALSCPRYGQGAILCMQITTRRLSYPMLSAVQGGTDWVLRNGCLTLCPSHGCAEKSRYMSDYNRDMAIRRSSVALGASGSVNASVIFNILWSPYSKVLIYGIIPMPAWALGGLWLAYDISGAMVGHSCSSQLIISADIA